MTFRTVERFSRNDWDCFAGAERFSDGTDPFITTYEPDDMSLGYENLIMIADKSGITVYVENIIESCCFGKNWREGTEPHEDAIKFALMGFMTTLRGMHYDVIAKYLEGKGFNKIWYE